jgi:hypothetical protein
MPVLLNVFGFEQHFELCNKIYLITVFSCYPSVMCGGCRVLDMRRSTHSIPEVSICVLCCFILDFPLNFSVYRFESSYSLPYIIVISVT